MIADTAQEYIEHGYLRGQRALHLRLDTYAPRHAPDFGELRGQLLIYLFITNTGEAGQREADYAARLAVRVRPYGPSVIACVRPGVNIPDTQLARQSILRVTEGDVPSVGPLNLDARLGCVSLHCWPGEAVVRHLEAGVEASLGRYFVLPQDQIGDAKAWMASDRAAQWRMAHAYPLNDLEVSELAYALG